MNREKLFEGTIRTCAHRVSFWFKTTNSLTEQLKTILFEEAENRAHEMISKDGCEQGELNYESDKISARGWWRIDD
jgi:hypothetical protein